jgi:hypothetical protein
VRHGILSDQAVLWHGGEALAEGSLSDCIRQWDGLPRLARSHAYIQINGQKVTKNVLLPRDLYSIGVRELHENTH